MARTQTSYVEPGLTREEQEIAMAALAASAEPTAPATPEPAAPVEAAPQTSAPMPQPRQGPGSAEMEALANYKPQSSFQQGLANAMAAIAESTGTQGAMARTQAAQRGYAQDRTAAIDRGRELDRRAAPADQATREIMKLGGLSDDAVGQLTQGSQAMDLARSGMGQLGARYRGQELTAQQKAEHDANMRALAEMRLDAQNQRQDKSIAAADSRLDKSLASREKIAAKKGGKKTPEQVAASAEAQAQGDAALLAAHANVTEEQAAAFTRGEPVDVPPEKLERLKIGKGLLASGMLDRGKAALNTFGREGANVDMPERSVAAQRGNVEKKRQVRDELRAGQASVNAAISSWKALSPAARDLLVKNGGLAPSQLMSAFKSARLSDQEQVAAARLQRLINDDIKKYAGSAVSSSEGGRQATAIGLPSGDFNPWQSPAVIHDYLNKVRTLLKMQNDSAVQAYPDLWKEGP